MAFEEGVMMAFEEGDDVIDSRDVIERIAELSEERGPGDEPLTEDEHEELSKLVRLQSDAEGYSPDWTYGATLIADRYFTQYAGELADDLGLVDHNASWPSNHIDWESAAEELKQDYTLVMFGDTEYWVR